MPATRPIALEAHVAPTREEAIAIAQPFLEAKYAAYAEWGQDKALPGEESFRVPFEDLARDTYAEPEIFYSYRRSVHLGEPDYGRHIAAIALL